jgi:hypothetical protein
MKKGLLVVGVLVAALVPSGTAAASGDCTNAAHEPQSDTVYHYAVGHVLCADESGSFSVSYTLCLQKQVPQKSAGVEVLNWENMKCGTGTVPPDEVTGSIVKLPVYCKTEAGSTSGQEGTGIYRSYFHTTWQVGIIGALTRPVLDLAQQQTDYSDPTPLVCVGRIL